MDFESTKWKSHFLIATGKNKANFFKFNISVDYLVIL